MTDVFICDYIRTPIGRYGGGLSSIRTDDLGALPLTALVERNPTMDLAAIDEVRVGDGCDHHRCARDQSR